MEVTQILKKSGQMPPTHFLAQAAKLGGLTLISSGLGFARELLIARKYGASHITDSYLVAVSVPMLIYALFFGSGLNVSLVPRLAVALQEDQARGRAMFAQFLSGAALCSGVAVFLILWFPKIFVKIFAPGISHSIVAIEAVSSLSPLLFLFVVSYALGSFHCARDRASRWGLTLVVQNLTLVIVLLVVGARMGMAGLVIGTLGGALLALLVQAKVAATDGFHERWSDPFGAGPGRDILIGMSAFALVGGLGGDYGTTQADIFLIRFFGSHLGTGSITLLALGNKLMGFPVVLIGAALGLALLPSLSVAMAGQDQERAGQQLSQALSYGLLIICPISVIYFDLGAPIVNAVFLHTALGQNQVLELGQVLRAYSGAATAMVVMLILNSYLAALRRTRTLISAGIFAVLADAGLMGLLGQHYGARGIAFAVSAGSFLYCIVLAVVLVPQLSARVRGALLTHSALIGVGALGMHVFLIGAVRFSTFSSESFFGKAVMPLFVGMTVYLGWVALHRKRLQLAPSGTW